MSVGVTRRSVPFASLLLLVVALFVIAFVNVLITQ